MVEERRTEELSALKEQLRLYNECNKAKEELKKLEKKRDRPQSDRSFQEPYYNVQRLEDDYNYRIDDIDRMIRVLEKKKEEPTTTSTGGGGLVTSIFVLLSIAAGIATLIYYIVKHQDLLLGILLGAAAFFGIAIIGVLLDSLLESLPKRIRTSESQPNPTNNPIDEQIQNYEKRKKELKDELAQKKRKAYSKDAILREEHKVKVQEQLEKLPLEIDAKKKEIKDLEAKYEAASIIPHSDNIDKVLKEIIQVITERYADTIPEARRWLEEKKEKAQKEVLDFFKKQDEIQQQKKLDELKSDLLWEQAKNQRHREKVEDELEKIRRGY